MEWHKEPRDIPSKFFALHTLAHLLIRSLSFECGYSAASIQERIYCSDSEENAMSGVLIFTAAGDAEGTLGGLIQMGKPENFDRLLRNALASAITCSSDPLCIESRGQGTDALNLAACYACCLLPETSCEEGNRLLDRVCLVGEPEDVDLGLFTDLSKQMI